MNAARALALALIDPWLWLGSGSLAGFAARLPRYFFETNTGVVLLFIVGLAIPRSSSAPQPSIEESAH